ncbi:MAG: ACP S-malonyltransferase [Thermomicrobiales bacterium]|nr:ACP S-malonyltransferase [Thermomicrobiales bacterium]
MSESSIPAGPVTLVFPGQGSQFVSMGTALTAASPAAAAILAEADEILGVPLTALMADGPAETLEDTWNAQPAILAVSVAALEAMRTALTSNGATVDVRFVAGHSLGEFSALVATGSLTFAEALTLVRERGRLMKEAGTTSPGGMAAVLGLDDEAIASVCATASAGGGIVVPANRNCPGQIVISGDVETLERAMELAKSAGARRVARLGVSIASHSPLMANANAAFGAVLDGIDLVAPVVPVIGNVSAHAISSVDELRDELRLQMERPVDWTGTVQAAIRAGTQAFIELGPGNVLGGLSKRIDRNVPTLTIGSLGLGLPDTLPAAP